MDDNSNPIRTNKRSSRFNTDDEISLQLVFNILKKRKQIILGSFLLSIALGYVVSFFLPQVYESHSVIEFAQIANTSLVDPTIFETQLIQKYGHDEESSYLANVSIDSDHRFVTLSARGHSAVKTHDFLQLLVSKIILQQNHLYSTGLKIWQNRLDGLSKEIAYHRKLSDKISLLGKSQKVNINSVIFLMMMEDHSTRKTPDILERQAKLAQEISDIESFPSRLILPPTHSAYITVTKLSYIILFGGLGIMFGVFIAFISEFISNIQKNIITPSDCL